VSVPEDHLPRGGRLAAHHQVKEGKEPLQRQRRRLGLLDFLLTRELIDRRRLHGKRRLERPLTNMTARPKLLALNPILPNLATTGVKVPPMSVTRSPSIHA